MRFIGDLERAWCVQTQDIIHGFVELYSERHPSRIWVCLEKCWWLQVPLWPDCLHVARVLEVPWKLWTNHCDIAVSLETLCPLCCYARFWGWEMLPNLFRGFLWERTVAEAPLWPWLACFYFTAKLARTSGFLVKSWIWMNCKSCHQVFPGTGQARDIFQDTYMYWLIFCGCDTLSRLVSLWVPECDSISSMASGCHV